MASTPTQTGPEMAKSFESVVTENAARAETERTLPADTVNALWDSGLMQWMNPEIAAGAEPGLIEMIDTWEELARQDAHIRLFSPWSPAPVPVDSSSRLQHARTGCAGMTS